MMVTPEDPPKETLGLGQWPDHIPMEIVENRDMGLQNPPEHAKTCSWIWHFLMIDREEILFSESIIQVFESSLGF